MEVIKGSILFTTFDGFAKANQKLLDKQIRPYGTLDKD